MEELLSAIMGQRAIPQAPLSLGGRAALVDMCVMRKDTIGLPQAAPERGGQDCDQAKLIALASSARRGRSRRNDRSTQASSWPWDSWAVLAVIPMRHRPGKWTSSQDGHHKRILEELTLPASGDYAKCCPSHASGLKALSLPTHTRSIRDCVWKHINLSVNGCCTQSGWPCSFSVLT